MLRIEMTNKWRKINVFDCADLGDVCDVLDRLLELLEVDLYEETSGKDGKRWELRKRDD